MPKDTASMEDNGLPRVQRFITDHNEEGKAIFSTKVPEALDWQKLPDGAKFALGYATDQFPVTLNNEADLQRYEAFQKDLPGITVPGGTVLRLVDMLPGALSPMHRTVSLDYGVVLEGQVELILDSGETRLLNKGDIAIQRGTNHAWRNPSSTKSSRMLYVLQESKPLEIEGKRLGEDYGDMPGVRPSVV